MSYGHIHCSTAQHSVDEVCCVQSTVVGTYCWLPHDVFRQDVKTGRLGWLLLSEASDCLESSALRIVLTEQNARQPCIPRKTLTIPCARHACVACSKHCCVVVAASTASVCAEPYWTGSWQLPVARTRLQVVNHTLCTGHTQATKTTRAQTTIANIRCSAPWTPNPTANTHQQPRLCKPQQRALYHCCFMPSTHASGTAERSDKTMCSQNKAVTSQQQCAPAICEDSCVSASLQTQLCAAGTVCMGPCRRPKPNADNNRRYC